MSANIKTRHERQAEQWPNHPGNELAPWARLKLADAEIADLRAALQAQKGEAIPDSSDSCIAISPPDFPKYYAGSNEGEMSREDLWEYACLTGWRTGHFHQGKTQDAPAVAQDAKVALAPATLSDEQAVETAARAMAKHADWDGWDTAKNVGDTLSGNSPEDERDYFRDMARLALAAAGSSQGQDIATALGAQAIEVEKMLCKALGREWSAAGISVESLIAALASKEAK